jgi:Fe-S-cluster containining protein
VLFDCQACGACCCNTQKNIALRHRGYVEVLPSDALFHEPVLSKLTVLDDKGVPQMRLVGEEQRCVALSGTLGERVRCTIYDLRPQGCRLVEPGDDECLLARKKLRGPRAPDPDFI